jgi:hypothetical protein
VDDLFLDERMNHSGANIAGFLGFHLVLSLTNAFGERRRRTLICHVARSSVKSRLDAIIDIDHALVKLARTIDWSFLEQRLGAVYEDKPGRRRCRRG